jgi:TolB-like protein/Tfp pilus assembly protein PilF
MSILVEIKRRKIFQVAAVYLVVAWLLIQIVATVEAPLSLPDWVDTLVILLLAIGFPVTLVMSWGFNLTPDGVVKDQGSNEAERSGGRRIEYALIGLLAVAMVWVIYRVEISPSEQPVELDADEAVGGVLSNSIAVLPFENLSPDPDNAYFAAGIHESTLNQLAKIRDLIVMSRSSVMQYEENRPPIVEIAKALNVETVMEGSVRYANGRVLITAQLIDGKTDAHLWSDEFNLDLTDVFAVQAEVARQIAIAMHVRLLPDEVARISRRATESTEAYQYFLRALSVPLPAYFPENRRQQIELLKQAIAADPNFTDAHARLAVSYYNDRQRDIGAEFAQKAIELDPTVGTAYLILGLTHANYYARQEEARAALLKVKEYSPNYPDALSVAARYQGLQSGDWAEAIQMGRRAAAIEPNHSFINTNLAGIYLFAGEWAAAASEIRALIRRTPDSYEPYADLATIEYLLGNRDSARENLDRAVNNMPPLAATGRVDRVAYLYGLLGDIEMAESLLARLEAVMVETDGRAPQFLGWSVLGTRDRERSLQEWTRMIDGYLNDDQPVSLGRITRFRDNLLNDPMLEEPEFLELRRRLGFKG